MKSSEKDIQILLKDVSNRIKNLEKIAKEQKILVLNVLIEASRTGESGKGLKVAANQMRELTESVIKMYESILEDIDSIYNP